MTNIDIDTIREREQAADSGPWRVVEEHGRDIADEAYNRLTIQTDIRHGEGREIAEMVDPDHSWASKLSEENAEFIAHARQDVPVLLAKVDELTAALAEARATADVRQGQLTKSREQAATYANEVGNLTAENARVRQRRDELREQVFVQKPVVKAAEAWAEAWEELKGDDTVPYVIAQPSALLHDAIEQHRLMAMALTSARDEQPAATR